jgi:hypothetical protein
LARGRSRGCPLALSSAIIVAFSTFAGLFCTMAICGRRARAVPRDNQKPTFSDNPPMHLTLEHASLGATPVKPEAARGGGLKGQALRA